MNPTEPYQTSSTPEPGLFPHQTTHSDIQDQHQIFITSTPPPLLPLLTVTAANRSLVSYPHTVSVQLALDESLTSHIIRILRLRSSHIDHRSDALHTTFTALTSNIKSQQPRIEPVSLLQQSTNLHCRASQALCGPSSIGLCIVIPVQTSTQSIAQRCQGDIAQRRGILRKHHHRPAW